METPLEVILVGFCGVVLTFALIFVSCWCLVSVSFFCVKYLCCSNLKDFVSLLNVNVSRGQGETDNSEDEEEEELSLDLEAEEDASRYYVSHHHHHSRGRSRSNQTTPSTTAAAAATSSSNPLEGTLVEENDDAETGSTGKVTRRDDVPPVYDFPPAYDSLFPIPSSSKDDRLDEILIIANQGALQSAGILELNKSQSQQTSEA